MIGHWSFFVTLRISLKLFCIKFFIAINIINYCGCVNDPFFDLKCEQSRIVHSVTLVNIQCHFYEDGFKGLQCFGNTFTVTLQDSFDKPEPLKQFSFLCDSDDTEIEVTPVYNQFDAQDQVGYFML